MGQKLYRVGIWVAVLAMMITGCAGASGGTPDDSVQAGDVEAVVEILDLPDDVTPETVAELNARGEIFVVDVREDWEYAEGHVSGATLIPLGSIPDRVDDIPTDKPVVLVCRSGNRSGQAFRYLVGEGFDNVHNMTGGMNAWRAAGLDVEK